ncbi:MAG: Homogentisate 1,2-dioxygenase [Deltaproteobacteria bacterium]|nr:Homogentisate 1,2-dioxygenase [Deltaproteobacteria bacterium]
MLDRMCVGDVARKHHIQLRGPGGELRYEECFTRDGFEGPYTILYHLRRPHTQRLAPGMKHGWLTPVAAPEGALAKRHYRSSELAKHGGPQLDARVALLFNEDLIAGVAFPTAPDPVYIADGDADQLIYIHRGGGTLRSVLGDVGFAQGDYVHVPRGLTHRFLPDATLAQHWFWFSLIGGVHVPRQWRNDVGQLRMDAPYSHRDFKRPAFEGPRDEGIRELVVRRGGVWHGFALEDSPLDAVGWDGTVYPWAFPILNFQPRVSSVHLPPTWHGTFAAKGALVCSFVPRPVDFHPEAIPCPYPHSSTHCDEIIFYCDGNFTSRRGVAPGSISHHPMGLPHGPHPGSYEKSIGTTRTDELAVMVDTYAPLRVTPAALGIEDANYQDSFV